METNDKSAAVKSMKSSRMDEFRSRGTADLEGLRKFRGRNFTILGILTASVIGVYGYTIWATKQEDFLDTIPDSRSKKPQ